MNLIDVRRKFRTLSGRYDLVSDAGADQGADFFINAGVRHLDRRANFQKSIARTWSKNAAGTYLVKTQNARAITEVWVATPERRRQLRPRLWQDLRATYTNPWASLTRGTPLYYSPVYVRPYPENMEEAGVVTLGAETNSKPTFGSWSEGAAGWAQVATTAVGGGESGTLWTQPTGLPLTAGLTWCITVEVEDYTSGSFVVKAIDDDSTEHASPAIAANGIHTFTFTSTTYPGTLHLIANSFDGTVLSYSLKPVTVASSTTLASLDWVSGYIDAVTDGSHALYNAVLILPPPDVEFMAELVGTFYSTKLTADSDTNLWTELWPDLVVQAACMEVEKMHRNTQGMQDWFNALELSLTEIEKDSVEEMSAGDSVMEG